MLGVGDPWWWSWQRSHLLLASCITDHCMCVASFHSLSALELIIIRLQLCSQCWDWVCHACGFVMHVVCPAVGDMEHLIGSSEGGLSVPALDIKQPTPVGDRSPTSARSSTNKGEKKNSAGKRGELVCCGSGYHADLLASAQVTCRIPSLLHTLHSLFSLLRIYSPC